MLYNKHLEVIVSCKTKNNTSYDKLLKTTSSLPSCNINPQAQHVANEVRKLFYRKKILHPLSLVFSWAILRRLNQNKGYLPKPCKAGGTDQPLLTEIEENKCYRERRSVKTKSFF